MLETTGELGERAERAEELGERAASRGEQAASQSNTPLDLSGLVRSDTAAGRRGSQRDARVRRDDQPVQRQQAAHRAARELEQEAGELDQEAQREPGAHQQHQQLAVALGQGVRGAVATPQRPRQALGATKHSPRPAASA